MSDVSTPAAASAPASTNTPASTPSSSTSVASSSPTRSTTADLAAKLYSNNKAVTAPPASAEFETPELDVEQTSSSAESPWYEREVHGLQAQAILEALQEGRIPEELYEKLRFDLQDGDDVAEVDLHGLRNGAMMQKAFTRKTQELAAEKREFFAERDEFANYLRGWKGDPQQFLFGAERLGLPILETAKLLAERLTYADQLNAAVPGAGDQWMAAEQLKAEHADMKRQQEQYQQAQQKNQQADKTSKVRTTLQNTSKEIFSKIGLELEASSWDRYTQHVQAIYDSKPSGNQKLTKQDLERAARATKTEFEQYAQSYLNRKPKKQQGLGAASLDAGAPKTVPGRAPQKPGGKTTEQFLEAMKEKQRGNFR